jgi:hypothetical protein
MGSVGYQSAYATDIVAVQRVFYNQTHNFSYQVRIVHLRRSSTQATLTRHHQWMVREN